MDNAGNEKRAPEGALCFVRFRTTSVAWVPDSPPQGVYCFRRRLSPTITLSPLSPRSLAIIGDMPPSWNASNVEAAIPPTCYVSRVALPGATASERPVHQRTSDARKQNPRRQGCARAGARSRRRAPGTAGRRGRLALGASRCVGMSSARAFGSPRVATTVAVTVSPHA